YPPPRSLRAGNVLPLIITKDISPLLIQLSQIALKKYNDDNNQDPPFEFDQLVKSTRGMSAGYNYFITFKAAKQSSNTSSTIFQAHVWAPFDGSSPKVVSCAIKIT
ncbi:cystatin-related protein, partial [Trifolium pratense]